MEIVHYNYEYEFFNNVLSRKMEVREGKLSVFENVFSKFFGVGAIDRTKTLEKSLNTKILFPIPSKIDIKETYEEIVKDSITRISSKLEFDTMLYYDGSIDATVTLLALIENSLEPIIYIPNEVLNVHKDFINSLNLKNMIISDNVFYGYNTRKHNIIGYQTGKVVNDCDYVNTLMKSIGSSSFEELNEEYTELQDYFKTYLYTENLNTLMEFTISELIRVAPFEIKTTYQLLYWISYVMAFQGLNFRFWDNDIVPQKAFKNIIQFYNTDLFQRYSLINMTKDVTKENFKKDAKEFIKNRTDLYNVGLDYHYSNEYEFTDVRFLTYELRPYRDNAIIL